MSSEELKDLSCMPIDLIRTYLLENLKSDSTQRVRIATEILRKGDYCLWNSLKDTIHRILPFSEFENNVLIMSVILEKEKTITASEKYLSKDNLLDLFYLFLLSVEDNKIIIKGIDGVYIVWHGVAEPAHPDQTYPCSTYGATMLAIDPKPEMTPFLIEAYNNSNNQATKYSIIWSLGKIGTKSASSFLKTVYDAELKSNVNNAEHLALIIDALGKCVDSQEDKMILDLLNSNPGEDIAKTCLMAMIRSKSKKAINKIYSILKSKNNRHMKRFCAMLLPFYDNTISYKLLKRLIECEESSDTDKFFYLLALGMLKNDSQSLFEKEIDNQAAKYALAWNSHDYYIEFTENGKKDILKYIDNEYEGIAINLIRNSEFYNSYKDVESYEKVLKDSKYICWGDSTGSFNNLLHARWGHIDYLLKELSDPGFLSRTEIHPLVAKVIEILPDDKPTIDTGKPFIMKKVQQKILTKWLRENINSITWDPILQKYHLKK